MKYLCLFISLFICCECINAQQPAQVSLASYYEKGKRLAGGSFSLFRTEFSQSKTQLDLGGMGDRIGLNISPQYGVFAARNWMIGAYGILGYARENDGFVSASTNSFGSGFSYGLADGRETYIDIGVAAFSRYYVPLHKTNVVSLFFHGGVPIVYSSSDFTANPSSSFYSNASSQRLRAGFELGVGVACNGSLGSFEMMLGFRGLQIGFYRALSPRRK